MDLELTDEQTLAERVPRDAAGPRVAPGADGAERRRARARRAVAARWSTFGALSVDARRRARRGRAVPGRRARSARTSRRVPYLGSAALRYAVGRWPIGSRGYAQLVDGRRCSCPSRCSSPAGMVGRGAQTTDSGRTASTAARWQSSTPTAVDRLAVVAAVGRHGPGSSSLTADAPGVAVTAQPAFDATVPMQRGRPRRRRCAGGRAVAAGPVAAAMLRGSPRIGGAARRRRVRRRGRAAARRRAHLRGRAPPVRPHDRQLPGAAPPPGRHVRAPGERRGRPCSTRPPRSTTTLDEAGRTAAIAKAYVARAAREVAHGAMQVFGGIAFTEEHPAHRFLRRIVVREQQFGDAAHHERELGRALAAAAPAAEPGTSGHQRSRSTDGRRRRMTETGFNDPTAQRLERDRRPAPTRRSSARCSPTCCTTRAGWRCDVALISGGKSNLTYRVASRRRRGHPAAPAARAHPADGARHGPRVPRPHRARRHRRAGAAHAVPRRRRRRRSARRST